MSFTDSDERHRFLTELRNAVLATRPVEGPPQLSPVWFLWTDHRFVVSAAATTAKVANIRRDPRISLCLDDVDGGRYAVASGHAELLEGDDEVREPTLALIAKYRPADEVVPHWERIRAEADRVVIDLVPDRWIWRAF